MRYVNGTYLFAQQAASGASASSNSVIYANFPSSPKKNLSAEKVNRFLIMILLVLVFISGVSYYFVSESEKKMNNLAKEIIALSNENIELQNKIDNLHSFNKVDVAIHSKTTLDTAKKVIEIPAAKNIVAPKAKRNPVNFNWSIGY